ncbi:MAG TPA: hypothetical protein VEB23_02920 [Ramlibacter sp.]|nr:hypothetical protein [Ramlibacter sp.]
MAFLLNPRVLITLALVALLAFSHLTAYRKGKQDVRNEWAAAVAQANADARKLEQQRQRRADEAGRIAAASSQRDRAAVDRARAERDGMRDTLDAIERASRESHDAATRHLAALRAVLDQCTAEYLRMAEAAAGHARDSLMYQQAWPK